MPKALIIVANGFTDSEFTYAFDRCKEEDIDVLVATLDGSDAIGEKGWKAKADISTWNAKSCILGGVMSFVQIGKVRYSGLFDLLLLPGGVKSIEKVRLDRATIEIIQSHHKADKIIGFCCHGAQLAIEADLCRGRRVAGYFSIRKDIENAGGIYCDTYCTDGSIVSAAHYAYNGKWMRAVLDLWKQRQAGDS